MNSATKTIYLDYNASTPIAPEVIKIITETAQSIFGNPSSQHWAGTNARALVNSARKQVASLLSCSPEEIVFTSSGSEANNLVIKSAFYGSLHDTPHFITTQIEHPATLAPLRFLEGRGAEVTHLPVDKYGQVNPSDLLSALQKNTVLITIMHANNETGTIQPITECAQIAREHGIQFHTDAAQSAGKITTNVNQLGVDFLSIAGHKMYAPVGIGALFIRRGAKIEPLIHGAGHENGRRAGTESVLMTAALGKACEIAADPSAMENLKVLRDKLHASLKEAFGEDLVLNGHPHDRLPNTLNVSILGLEGNALLAGAPEVAASTGSACHSGKPQISSVLSAIGADTLRSAGAIRFSLGRYTTYEDVQLASKAITESSKKLRSSSSV